MDPVLARQHAQTAATLAYNRALERNSADVGHSATGPRCSNTVQNRPSRQSLSGQANPTPIADDGVKRQNSVRFAGPNAIQRRQSTGPRTQPLQPKSSTHTLRPVAMTTNAPVPAAYRPPSRSSSIGRGSIRKVTADTFMDGNAFEEYYTREDDVASTPSSYRRIRKSKSMFSPLKAPSVFYTNGTPDRAEDTGNGAQSTSSNPRASTPSFSPFGLRAPKSMSFLRSSRQFGELERNDQAVQMARDRFFQDTAQQRLREQPSFLFRSRAHKQDKENKPFRKSVRSSSGGSCGISSASANANHALKETGLRDVARKASKTIKDKLRRVFGRTKDEPVSVPNQQVDARETHVRGYNGDGSAPPEDFADIPYPDDASLSRVATRVPSLHAVNSNQQLRSYAGSLKSAKSLKSEYSDDKSRVTSWTSAGVNTVTSQVMRTQNERDQQRLSIINEVGTHIPSSSFSKQRPPSQYPPHPVVTKVCIGANHGPVPRQPGQVDSMRVYSALMKRLDENSPKTKLDVSQRLRMENYPLPNCTPRSRVSIEGSPNRSLATIRHVIPEESNEDSKSHGSCNQDHQWVRADSINSARAENMFGYTGTHVHQWTTADSLREARMRNSDDVFSPKTYQLKIPRPTSSSSNKENMPPGDLSFTRDKSNASASAISQLDSTQTSYHTVPETLGLTPQEMANRNEPTIPGSKGLRDSRSTFFGGGSSVTVARRLSPFRRAMFEGGHVQPDNGVVAQVNVPAIKNPLYFGPDLTSTDEARNHQELEIAYSESVYSRTTSGRAPVGATSVLSLPLSDSDNPEMPASVGDVVILDRKVYRPPIPDSSGRRVTDSMGSTDWKKWMSSEVAKLERAKDNTVNAPYVNYALPTMPRAFHTGHVRESAQISDEDVEVPQTRIPSVKQPLSIVQPVNPNIQNPPVLKPILKKRSTVSLVETTEKVNQPTSTIPIPIPPPIPPRSPLRLMPSKSSLRSTATINTIYAGGAPDSASKISGLNGKNLLHKRNVSQTTLKSVKSAKSATLSIKSVETPAKLVKRNRPYTSNVNTPSTSPGEGLSAAVDRQFGSLRRERTPRDSHLLASRENMRKKMIRGNEMDEADIYGVDGSGLLGPVMGVSRGGDLSLSLNGSQGHRRGGDLSVGGSSNFGGPSWRQGNHESESSVKRLSTSESEAQAMGSKMMVDLFLSSRRKRIASAASDDGEREQERGAVFL